MKPKTNCISPAIIPAQRNSSKAPSSVIAVKTIAVRPAAGPKTQILE